MLDIDGIKKRIIEAEHYATCPKSRNECKRCEDWFYSATTVQSIILAFVNDIKAIAASRDTIIQELSGRIDERDDARRGLTNTLAELDELRTRHARMVDSTDTFIAALVDERFKKDHAAMVAELESLRTKDIEASKRLRIEINAMPETARAVFESARVEAKAKGSTILRALVEMVANARAVQMMRGNELTALKDECRKHLARINVLESELSSFTEKRQPPKEKIRPAITCGSKLLWYAVEYANSKLRPGDCTPTAEQLTDAAIAMKPKLPGTPWLAMVRWYVENNMRELDGARFESVPIPMILHCPSCNAPDAQYGSTAHLVCTCPATSEYDNPCPRHGVIGIGITPRD